MNVDSFDQEVPVPRSKERRSLSFSHSRFHRRSTSSSNSEDEDTRNTYFYDNEEDTRDSLSDFSRVTLNDHENHGRAHKRSEHNDDLSAITRKRTFSSSDPADFDSNNGKPASEKRAATKICRVCGDKAYSYNFSVVTCESCKAFFRRNANKEKDIRCPFNDNCDINIVSRRFCQKCRLAKCFKVGMKKEWIMSEEARREKKQRIQDNRERKMAERAQEELHQQMPNNIEPAPTQIVTNGIQLTPPSDPTMVQPPMASSMSSMGQSIGPLPALNSNILPHLPIQQGPPISTIIEPASIVSMPLPVASMIQPIIASHSEPTSVMQQIQQAQQAQNAQLLAQVAMQAQPDAIASIQQQAAQIASIGTTAVPSQTSNAVATANLNNLNHLAQVAAMQTPPDAIASIQQVAQAAQAVQAAQIASIGTTSIQLPTTNASIVSNLNNLAQAAAQIQQKVQLEQMQQQINANLAAQRLQVSQNLADQQQLATAVAIASAVSNQAPMVPPHPEPIQPSIAQAILPAMLPSSNPAPMTSVTMTPQMVEPVLPPVTNPNNEMIAVRKDVLMGIVQENIENRQAQIHQQMNTPPVKCKCFCQCGRYSSDSVIVDKVMSDMLTEANKAATPPANQMIESMDCSRHDSDCCMLTDDDKMALNELEQADKIFWSQPDASTIETNATDAALRKLIRMVTSLNSFNKFSRADQSNLLKHGCASHFAIRQAMTNINENPQNLMVVQFYNSLREEWRTNRQMMLLLSVMVIFDPDTPQIENRPQIAQTCNRLKSILKRMLFSMYLDHQKCILEFDDLINKLNVLQSLNNNSIPQSQNGIDSLRLWSAEIVEPLLSRELFEPNLMATSNVINTISSMT